MEKEQHFATDQVKTYGLKSEREIPGDNGIWLTHYSYLE